MRGVSVLAFGTLVSQTLTAIAFWMAARASAPAEFGSIAAALAIALLTTDVLDFGINTVLVRDLAGAHTDADLRDAIGRTLGLKLVLALAGVAAWTALAAAGRPIFGGGLAMLMLGAYVGATVVSLSAASALRGLGRNGLYATVGIIEDSVMVGVTGFLVFGKGFGANALVYGFAAGAAASAATAILFLPAGLRTVARPGLAWSRRVGLSAIPFGTMGLTTDAVRLDVAILRVSGGAAAAGLYAAASRLVRPLTTLVNTFCLVLFPQLAAIPDHAARRRAAGRATLITATSTLLIAAPAMMLARPIVRLVLGAPYVGSVQPLRILLAAVILVAIDQPLVTLAQIGNRPGDVAWAMIFTTSIGLTGAAVAGHLWKASGAAAAALLIPVLMLLLLLTLLRRPSTAVAESVLPAQSITPAVLRHKGPRSSTGFRDQPDDVRAERVVWSRPTPGAHGPRGHYPLDGAPWPPEFP